MRPQQFGSAKIGCHDVFESTLKNKEIQYQGTSSDRSLNLKRTLYICVCCLYIIVSASGVAVM